MKQRRPSILNPGNEPVPYNSLDDPRMWLAIGTGLAMLVFFILLIVLNEPSPLKNPATWLAISLGVGMLISFIVAIVLKKP